MSFKNKYIKIIDWAGNELFHGEFDSPELDKEWREFMTANRDIYLTGIEKEHLT